MAKSKKTISYKALCVAIAILTVFEFSPLANTGVAFAVGETTGISEQTDTTSSQTDAATSSETSVDATASTVSSVDAAIDASTSATAGQTLVPQDDEAAITPQAGTLDNVFIGSTTGSKNSSGAAAADTNNGASPSSAVATFAKAKSLLKTGGTIWVVGPVSVTDAQNWNLNGYGAGGSGSGLVKRWDGTSATVTLAADQVAYDNGSMVLPSGASASVSLTHITIDGNGANVTTKGSDKTGQIFTLTNGANLSLGDGATLQNNKDTVDVGTIGVYGGAILIDGSGTASMSDGASIIGNTSQYGAAIFMNANDSGTVNSFTMTGGAISSNTDTSSNGNASIVRVQAHSGSSTFNMSGGAISGNKASNAVGVVDTYSVMNMAGGTITGNTSSGVLVNAGVLNMSAGKIIGNTIGGVNLSKATSRINVSGSANVTGNTLSGATANVRFTLASQQIGVTGALTGEIGVTTYSTDHHLAYEFAKGTSTYTTQATDAAKFSDDYSNPYGIENTTTSAAAGGAAGTDNTIRFKGYTITYNPNGNNSGSRASVTGDVPVDANAYPKGAFAILLDKGSLAWTGHSFGGWNTNSSGSGVTYAAGVGYKIPAGTNPTASDPGANTTMYAMWVPNAYTVKFNANGGAGTMNDEGFTYDASQALAANAFTRAGYTFNGWNTVATPTASNPGDSYTDEQSVKNLTSTANGVVTLYAQWKAVDMSATDIVMTAGDAISLDNDGTSVTDAALIAANNVTATISGKSITPVVESISPTTGKTDIHNGVLGTYTITYSAGTGQEKKTSVAKITVVPDGSAINGKDAAFAGTVIYKQTEAKALGSQTDLYTAQNCYGAYQADAIAAADMATNANVSQTVMSEDWANIKSGKVGSYDSNIFVGYAMSEGGKVVIVPDDTVVSGTDAISAQNTILTVTQAKALSSAPDSAALMYGSTINPDSDRIYNNVSGYIKGIAGSPDGIAQSFANPDDWDTITAGTIGTYYVTYMAGSASKTVTITVVPDGSVVGPTTDGDDAVYSRTILMKSSAAITAFGTASSSRVLMSSTYNAVHAVLNGQTIADPQADETDVIQTIASTDWDAIKSGTVGAYSVKYACGDSAPRKVRVIIIKDMATQNGDNAVVADGITITSTQAKQLESATSLYGQSYNYVEGYYADSNHADIDIVNNADAIANASGTPGAAGIITQYASNGTTLLSSSTDEWTNGIKAGKTGTYKVVYSITGQDTSQTNRTAASTVNVTVVPDGSTVVPNTGDAVYARTYLTTSADAIADFASATSDILYGASTSSASTEYNRVVIDVADAILTDSSTPTRKDVSTQTIASADWSAIQAGTTGAYDVSYKVTGDEASAKAAQVIVLPNGTIIDHDANIAVHGSTITITAATAKALSSQSQLYGGSYNDVVAVKDGVQISSANLSTAVTQTISTTDWNAIHAGTVGSYDVAYTVTSAKDTSKSVSTTGVKVVVVPDDTTIDPATNDTVTASSIVIDQSTAKGIGNASDLYGSSYNNVSGNIAGAPTTIDHISQTIASADWDAIHEGTVGTYAVTYETNGNEAAKRTVNVVIVPDGSDISGHDSAYAGVKLYTVEDAKALAGGNKTQLYSAQTANATSKGTAVTLEQMIAGTPVNGQTVAQNITDTDWSSVTSGTLGSYPSNISLNNAAGSAIATSTTGMVIVVPDGSTIDGANSAYAGVKIYTQTQAKALVKTSLYADQSASATSLGQTVTTAQMVAGTAVNGQTVAQTITQEDWGKVTSGTVGTYDSNIELDDASGAAQVTSTGGKVIVVSDDTVISGSDAAYAGTKTYTVNQAKALATGTSKVLYEAQGCIGIYQGATIAAADMASNTHVTQGISSGDWNAIASGTLGTYDSNITVGAATTTTGKVIIVPNGSVVDPDTNTSVSAQTVALTPSQAQALGTPDDLYGSSNNNVSGYIDGVAIAAPTSQVTQGFANATDWADISAGKLGTYDVTYTVASVADPTKTVFTTVQVIVSNSSGSKDGVVCSADDFWLQKGTEPTDSELVADAKATGYDTNTTPETALTPDVNSRGSLDTSKNGVYPDVSFKAANTSGATATATVTATVKDAVAKGTTYEISANDFELSIAEATALVGGTTATADARSGVAARVAATHLPEGWSADYSKVQSAAGTYDVTYSCNDDSTVSVTVKCAVKDSASQANGIVISGNTVYLSIGQTSAATTSDAIKKLVLDNSSAVAKRLDTGAAIAPTVQSTTTTFGTSAALGTYSATIAATYNDGTADHTATTNITVIVADHVGTSDAYVITANDFMVAKDATVTAADQVAAANAIGKAKSDGSASPVVLESSALDTSARGVYDVVLDTPSTTDANLATATVQATVKDVVNTDPENDETIGGNGFSISLDKANALSDSDIPELISLAAAKAYKTSDGSDVAITLVDYSSLKAATEISGNTYPVTFTTAAGTTVTVQATVTDSSKYDPTSDESISGNDYSITPAQAATIISGGASGKILAIASGQVKATKVATGATVDISTVDASKLSTTTGTYPVSYSTAAGTTITLYATVAGDDTTVDPATHEAIDAADFTIDTITASTLSNDQIMRLSGAKAWSTEDGLAVDITSINSTVQSAIGTYAVTFTTAAGTTRTITVTVVNVTPVSIDPPVAKTVTGNAPAAAYTFKMEAGQASNPMPADSSNGVKYASISMAAGAQSAQSVEFASMTFDTPGTYTYTISEKAGDDANMVYDSTVYTMKVVVTDVDGKLQVTKTIMDADRNQVETAGFTNAYTESASPTSPSSYQSSSLPKTSDQSCLPLLMLVLAALAGGASCLAARKRRNQR